MDRHVEAVARQADGDRLPDAAPGTGDQRDPARRRHATSRPVTGST